jgi:hypothetical protein
MRCTEEAETPTCPAIMAAVQWVASASGAASVRATTWLGDLRAERRNTRRPRFVAQQAVNPFFREALLPAPHAGLRLAG